MTTLIKGGTVVNEGREFDASVIVDGDRIVDIIEGSDAPRDICERTVDATGGYVFPGVIDSHVHFREPGMTHKADIDSESRAAAYGGVTSFFEMPNTVPQTVTQEYLDEKFRLGAAESHVNYSFFPGATNDNLSFLGSVDVHRVPGIKLFMGSSTGNMLVDKRQQLDDIFALAASRDLPLMAHCEDTQMINANMAHYKELFHTDDPDVSCHSLIRDAKACMASSSLGAELARKHGTRFHIAHLSTAEELSLVGGNITAEVCMPHLLFSEADYAESGTRIKCNPSVKTAADRDALRRALMSGRISTVSTDHAPHLLSEKTGGAAKALSGMPMVQFSLPAMLTLADEGWLSRPQVAQLMCHNQATLFGVSGRGFIRKGYKADITIVKRRQWQVTDSCVKSKCGWTPLCGRTLNWQVAATMCNGHMVYENGMFDEEYRGEEIRFRTDD